MNDMTWMISITGPDGEEITEIELNEEQVRYLVHYAIIKILEERIKEG
jgi:hypothetical protein